MDPCRETANTDLKDAVSREGFKSLLHVTNSSLSRAGRERTPGTDSDAPVTFHYLRKEGREENWWCFCGEKFKNKITLVTECKWFELFTKIPIWELLMKKGSACWYGKERFHTDKSSERLLTGSGVSWGHVTEGHRRRWVTSCPYSDTAPPQFVGTAPANMNGRDQENQVLPSETYFYMQTCTPTVSAPELWLRSPFSSFSSEVSSMDACYILKMLTRPLCRMTEKFHRALIICIHTLVITTKKAI